MFRKLVAAALLLAPAAAPAEWKAATSTHFVVYSEGSAASTKAIAEKLEKFGYALRWMHHAKDPEQITKVRLFMLPDMKAVQEVMPFNQGGSNEGGVAGFYNGDRRGPYAIMTRTGMTDSEGIGLSAQQVLFHEITHHFMFQYFPGTYPTWYVEGIADFYGSMKFDGDKATLGGIQEGRLQNMHYDAWMPVDKLLTARSYADARSVYMLYAEGWLLTYYNYIGPPARKGQLGKFLLGVKQGLPYDKAATAAYGDLGKLNAELADFSQHQKFALIDLPFKKIDTGPITVATVSPAEDAMLPYDLQMYAGIPQKDVAGFADRVTATAARFPTDPYALHILFEAQRLADRVDAQRATAETWLKAHPDDAMAMWAKGLVAVAQLKAAKATDRAQWNAARKYFIDAHQKLPDEPQILRAFYESYTAQGLLPPATAQEGLFAALQLEPSDDSLRQEVAADFEARGMIDDAITVIRPIALAMRDPAEDTPKQKARRDQDKVKYKLAGDDEGDDTPRVMLTRLEKKRDEARAKAATAKPAATG